MIFCTLDVQQSLVFPERCRDQNDELEDVYFVSAFLVKKFWICDCVEVGSTLLDFHEEVLWSSSRRENIEFEAHNCVCRPHPTFVLIGAKFSDSSLCSSHKDGVENSLIAIY
jgi:hypothetical protein